jgi:serine/threonine protein kinase
VMEPGEAGTTGTMTSRWFGDYEILRQLRVGAMATLYLARRYGAAGFSRLVALKLLHAHLGEQPDFLEMFVDEARICSHISHTNVVHVEEFGAIDGIHYLVMEYLDGCSVSDLLRVLSLEGGQLDPELAARVVLLIASGLHAAHETHDHDGQPLEIVHRDVSPSNILLSSDGNAKLIDFGIAKARNRLSETRAGVALKGKYNYMAPEQAVRAVVDRRCDIFSLGVVFWEMLVCRPLFPDGSHLGLFRRLEHTMVPPPSAVNPASPVSLDPIVLAMLQHDPEDRPRTAAEVQQQVAAALPGADNHKASELGALAIEIRDKHQALRAARHAAGEDPDSHHGLSPTPRTRRRMPLPAPEEPEEPEELEVLEVLEVLEEPRSESSSQAVDPAPLPVLPLRPRRRTRRIVQVGALCALAATAIIVIASRVASLGASPPAPRETQGAHPARSDAAEAKTQSPSVAVLVTPSNPSPSVADAAPAGDEDIVAPPPRRSRSRPERRPRRPEPTARSRLTAPPSDSRPDAPDFDQ